MALRHTGHRRRWEDLNIGAVPIRFAPRICISVGSNCWQKVRAGWLIFGAVAWPGPGLAGLLFWLMWNDCSPIRAWNFSSAGGLPSAELERYFVHETA